MTVRFRSVLICLFVVVVAGWQVDAQQRQLKPGFNLFSVEQDIQLGREAASEIEKQVQVSSDRELTEYFQRIGRRLASQPAAGKFPYTFKVVLDKDINAFALPGGFTYMNTGLIVQADNEAQIAGVIAHEISHVALRHGTNQASKANLIQLPALLAGGMAGSNTMLGQLAQLGIGLGAQSVLLKFSRGAEQDADLLGARIMSSAGYNPLDMARFFEKLEAAAGKGGPAFQFLSSHPKPGNRVKAVEQEIRYLPAREYDAGEGDLARMKTIVDSLHKNMPARRAPSNAQGTGPSRPADARPAGGFSQCQGPGFDMACPGNWKTFGDQRSGSVTFAAEQGLVQTGTGVSIAYGALAGTYSPADGRVVLDRDTAQLIRQFQADNPGLRASGSARRGRVDGSPALVTPLIAQSAFAGEREMSQLVTVDRGNALFYLVLIAPESESRYAASAFDQMLRSVRFRQH
jgi:Zn-dependent protease with chaperone function